MDLKHPANRSSTWSGSDASSLSFGRSEAEPKGATNPEDSHRTKRHGRGRGELRIDQLMARLAVRVMLADRRGGGDR